MIMIAAWSLALGLVVLIFPIDQRRDYLMLGLGILTGFVGSGAASIRMLRSGWPIYESAIDWSKVQSMEEEAQRVGR